MTDESQHRFTPAWVAWFRRMNKAVDAWLEADRAVMQAGDEAERLKQEAIRIDAEEPGWAD